jgi:hypothetical protein
MEVVAAAGLMVTRLMVITTGGVKNSAQGKNSKGGRAAQQRTRIADRPRIAD